MSTTDPAQQRATVRQYETREPTAYAEEGTGWVLFAVVMLSLIAALNLIDGVAAVGILVEWRGFRWAGVAIAGLNSIAQLLFMPAYPLWALTLFALDILVIYALVAYGAVD